jgi:hypothetical protein
MGVSLFGVPHGGEHEGGGSGDARARAVGPGGW